MSKIALCDFLSTVLCGSLSNMVVIPVMNFETSALNDPQNDVEHKKRFMGHVDVLVVLEHLPYDNNLSFMPNDHVADVKNLVFFKGAN